MIHMSEKEYLKHVEDVKMLYNIENLEAEAATWFEMRREKQELHGGVGELHGMLKHADLFPAVHHAICIALTLPVTTCTAERLFSTLRRVKTWLPSTMSDERLSGLCMMSVHPTKISKDKQGFIERWLIALEVIPDVCSSCFEVTMASRARQNEVIICGFVKDYGNASFVKDHVNSSSKRSTLL